MLIPATTPFGSYDPHLSDGMPRHEVVEGLSNASCGAAERLPAFQAGPSPVPAACPLVEVLGFYRGFCLQMQPLSGADFHSPH